MGRKGLLSRIWPLIRPWNGRALQWEGVRFAHRRDQLPAVSILIDLEVRIFSRYLTRLRLINGGNGLLLDANVILVHLRYL